VKEEAPRKTGPDLWRDVLKDAWWALRETNPALSERCKLAIEDMDGTEVALRRRPKRKERIIEILRKFYPAGMWRYDGRNTWSGGFGVEYVERVVVKSMSHCTIGVNGGETYCSQWYVEAPDGTMNLAPTELRLLLPVFEPWTD
jgi:hypothetical protein